MNIYFFLSGNLVAESLLLAAAAVASRSAYYKVHLVTDGSVLTQLPDTISELRRVDPAGDGIGLCEGDVLVTGMMWPGINERHLISEAKRNKAVSIVVLVDILGSADKFSINGSFFLPDYICVSDQLTYDGLIAAGIPKAIVAPIGSLYLDEVLRVAPPSCSGGDLTSIGYLTLPNRQDFLNWGRDFGYHEVSIGHHLKVLCKELGADLVIRKHPKECHSTKYDNLQGGLCRIEDHNQTSIVGFVISQAAVVSTYSTALIIAKNLQRKAISYQPGCVEPVKKVLYEAIGIPIATSTADLRRLLLTDLEDLQPNVSSELFFNVSRSREAFVNLISEIF